MNTENKRPQLFFEAESKQKNDALGGLFDVKGEIYVGTAENQRSTTLIDYLRPLKAKKTEETTTTVISLSSGKFRIGT